MKKRIFKIILSCLALIFVYFFLDISELPASIGLHAEKINWDIASIVISNLVVVCLYLITFALLDSKRIKMSKNQREVALLLLEETYDHCKGVVSTFDLRGLRAKIAEKCYSSEEIFKNEHLQRYQDLPFEFHEQIVKFACSGIISKKELSDYIQVRIAFQMHIRTRILSYDKDDLPDCTKKDFFEDLERAKQSLNRSEM